MKDWKNIISSIAGLLAGLAVALLGISTEVVFPGWVKTACIVVIAVAPVIIGWLQGRNANLTRKSTDQLKKQAGDKNLGTRRVN